MPQADHNFLSQLHLPVIISSHGSLSSQKACSVVAQTPTERLLLVRPRGSFGDNREMNKIPSLSLRRTPAGGNGKQAATYNYSVLNDKIKM